MYQGFDSYREWLQNFIDQANKCHITQSRLAVEASCVMCSGNWQTFLSKTKKFSISPKRCDAVIQHCGAHWYNVLLLSKVLIKFHQQIAPPQLHRALFSLITSNPEAETFLALFKESTLEGR